MKAIALIGANFVRGQWIVLAVMLLYVIGIAAVFGWHEQRSEVLFFFRQQAYYAIFLGTMVTIPAIQNERKSRRILAVLSKGIHRWQFIGGLLFGALLVAAIFCLVVALATYWLARQAAMPVVGFNQFMLVLFLGCAAGASVGLFCATFLHPFVALPVALLILLFPLAVEARGFYPPNVLFPVAAIVRMVWSFTFQKPGSGLWHIGTAAMAQMVLFWIAASVIFSRRDVTVTSE